MSFIAFTAEIRASMGIRTVTAIKDHPSGIVNEDDVVYALNKIKIFVPNPLDADEAAEWPIDRASFTDYFEETTPADPVLIDLTSLTYETFDATRRTELGVRQVRALKDSPIGLFATNDVLYAQKKFAIWKQKSGNANLACRFDFDGNFFDQYFVNV